MKGRAGEWANPGSPEAVAIGCRCPILDNGHGRGYMGQAGVFVYAQPCPLHGHFVGALPNTQGQSNKPADGLLRASSEASGTEGSE